MAASVAKPHTEPHTWRPKTAARRVLYGHAMKKMTKKLSLKTETVRALDQIALADVAGGASVLIRCGWSITCPAVCVQDPTKTI